MNSVMEGYLKGVRLGDEQRSGEVSIIPLTSGPGESPAYVTLAEAMENGWLRVEEVCEGGSVPDLRVTNSGRVAVLMLDGEELAGAKQNRVLNATILVPSKSAIIIPVSCTERGRWSYASPQFRESGNVMPAALRAHKMRAVTASLEQDGAYRSDQGHVWEQISDMQARADVRSPTSAMGDVFAAKRGLLENALAACPLIEGQTGLLVVAHGEPVGFDLLSLPSAFRRLHGKLVKSYIMDAILHRPPQSDGIDPSLHHATPGQIAKDVLAAALGCDERPFKSAGIGSDYRYKGPFLAGSALIHEACVIHTAFFKLDSIEERAGPMSGARRRGVYRVV